MLVEVLPLDGEIGLVSHQHDRDGAQVTLHVQQLIIHKLDHLETVAENNIHKLDHLETVAENNIFKTLSLRITHISTILL